MRRKIFLRFQLLATLLVAAGYVLPAAAQSLPQHKVDLSISNRSDDETLEPGYTIWRVAQGKSDTMVIDNVTYTLSCPAEAEYELRPGWSKTFIQNADNKSKNGRLTFDGIALDPTNQVYGQFTLKIDGLPAGTHSIQTYHNNWENPASWYGTPITVKCNGTVVHENVMPTFSQNLAPNACLLTTTFTIAKAGDAVEIEFSTSEANPGAADKGQANHYMVPVCNGFELNTVSITSQAKDPYPADGDMHTDADSKSITLKWQAANADVAQHAIYWALDSASVADATAPAATLTTTEYTLSNVYSMNTYYWRVDEIDAAGNVTMGKIWKFKPRQLAFTGAEGYGRFAQGGRGGVVYHVTSLSNENVPGTLYYGLKNTEMGPRTIVFDVSGIIDFGFEAIFIQPYVTLAGQTAPGKGICIKGSNINIGSDNICRHMRFKHGYGDTGNSMGLSGSNHTIVDHTTAAWGTDETVSGRGAKNISFQYSMIAEALGIADHKNYGEGTNHGYAATIDGKVGSWHHNLLLNCAGRNWSMGGGMDGQNKPIGQLDLFNNVVYNWNSRTTDGNAHEVNFVGNYYKMGPDTGNKILFSQDFEAAINPEGTNKAYISGNIRENKDGSLTTDAKNVTYRVRATNGGTIPTTYETIVKEPLFPSYATIHTAQDAFKIVTSEAGATMPMRDDQHLRVVDETIDGTYTYVGSRSGIKGEIDHENDCGGWEVYPEESRAADFDTDQDGMPDWYEKLTGTNPAAADNNNDPDQNGWTALEDYLEFMAHPYIVINPNSQTTFDAAPWFRGFKKTSPEYSIATGSDLFTASVSGSVINVKTNGNGGIGIITMKVKDNAGTTHEKRLSVAVTGETTGINNVWSEENIDVAKREFFTLDGKQATTFRQNDIYIMKVTDKNGKVYTMKAIRK